jgi:hypothetical protein
MRTKEERRSLHINARTVSRNIGNGKGLNSESYDIGGASNKPYKKVVVNSAEYYIELKGEKE